MPPLRDVVTTPRRVDDLERTVEDLRRRVRDLESSLDALNAVRDEVRRLHEAYAAASGRDDPA